MPYRYSLDGTTLSDIWFDKDTYVFYQAGLAQLRDLLQAWNEREPEPPYRQEVRDLTGMIEWAQHRLDQLRNTDDLFINGVSRGSLRYLKAAAILQVLEAEAALERQRADLPDGVIATRTRRVSEMKRLANVGLLAELDPADVLWEVAPSPRVRTPAIRTEGSSPVYEWDIFLSHATEDKEPFVTTLARELTRATLRVWYDGFELRLGDPLRRSIERGLMRSRYGVVVLSPRFFAKEWPQRELDGMAALEVDGRKVILPIWHDLGAAQVRARSPMLADRVAISSDRGVEAVVAEIIRAVAT